MVLELGRGFARGGGGGASSAASPRRDSPSSRCLAGGTPVRWCSHRLSTPTWLGLELGLGGGFRGEG